MNMRRLRIFALLTAMALGLLACASNRPTPVAENLDRSRPNYSSMFYYIVASYHFHGGDYEFASKIYSKASESDPRSRVIRKQYVISSIFQNAVKKLPKEDAYRIVEDNRKWIASDAELLDIVYDFYADHSDDIGMDWAINTMIANHPSPRAYILRFVYDFRVKGITNVGTLDPAIVLAANNPEELLTLGRLLAIVDKPKAVEVLTRLYRLAPDTEGSDVLSDALLLMEDIQRLKSYFGSLEYPRDKELMYLIADKAIQYEQYQQLLPLAHYILPTHDADLMYLVAIAALMVRDAGTLEGIGDSLVNIEGASEAEAYMISLLIAHALLENGDPDVEDLLGQLSCTEDFDNIIRFYSLAYGQRMRDDASFEPDSIYSEMENALTRHLSDSPARRYLLLSASKPSEDENQAEWITRRVELIQNLMNKGKHNAADISYLSLQMHLQGKIDAKITLLREAVELYPEEGEFLNDLGYTLLSYPESRQEAGHLIQRALQTDPENLYYLDSMAWYHYLNRDYTAALRLMQLPMQKEGMPAEIYYHAGMIHMRLSDFDNAVTFLQKAITAADDPKYVEKAQRALQVWGNGTRGSVNPD